MGVASPNFDIFLGDDRYHVPDGHLKGYTVERDMFQPDMAAIVLLNQSDVHTTYKIGGAVEIQVRGGKIIYQGEIVGLEPVYKGGEPSRILIRAMNKLHRLLRKRKSLTFVDKTDEQILSQVVGDAKLKLDWKHEESISYKHVYQHNQTDMEFLRTRAARMGCHVWCVNQTVFVKQPDLQGQESAILDVDDKGGANDPKKKKLRSFTPRLNSSGVLNKVTCKGWNPETKELITGDASVQNSRLGSQTSAAASGPFGSEETFMCDHPIWDAKEAKALAKARLQEASLSYITGEAECEGSGDFDIGTLLKITANASGKDPFNGKYYVTGLTHRHNPAVKEKDGSPYVTILRLARDAQDP